MHRRPLRADAHLLCAVVGNGPDIAGAETIRAHDLALRRNEHRRLVRDAHHVDARRVDEARGMVLHAEDRRTVRRVVGAYAFEDREAVVERVGEDMSGGSAPGHHSAVVPDPAVAVVHGFSPKGEPGTLCLVCLRINSDPPDMSFGVPEQWTACRACAPSPGWRSSAASRGPPTRSSSRARG